MGSIVIYLQGTRTKEEEVILLPLSSAVILFVVQYCGPELFHLKFSTTDLDETKCFKANLASLQNTKYEFDSDDQQVCSLPVVRQMNDIWVRSGLCGTIRYIVAQAHNAKQNEDLDVLLGFRRNSLKACAENSGWTKLCEVEIPTSITELVSKIRSEQLTQQTTLTLPEDLMKLEWHFLKSPKMHNSDKFKRPYLRQIQQEADLLLTVEDASRFQYNREIYYPHGLTKFFVNVNSVTKESCVKSKSKSMNGNPDLQKCSNKSMTNGTGSSSNKVFQSKNRNEEIGKEQEDKSVSDLRDFLNNMTIDDIVFPHLYSQGITISVADLILYTQIYHFLESIDFRTTTIRQHLQHILTWFDHMSSLPRMHRTAVQCGYKLSTLETNRDKKSKINFTVEDGLFEKLNEDDMELSNMCRGKYRPIKPDVWSALDKVVKGNIQVETGRHPRGDNTSINWSEVPTEVDPGLELPKKRLQKKREQLENLVTAVIDIAKPGDVIVDFCSGGGHLGIAVAHFLPKCKVYLIDNKEESLVRAKQRIDKLQMNNIVLYQCNQDYFKGKFDIGMCLHACGVSTDMVMRQCLQSNASFVICPCCYGGVRNTHLMTYPTSNYYKEAGIVYKDFLTLGHAADQTEFNMVLEEQGKYCANLVDTDRAALAKERGYKVTLCSLKPLTCTPKNNLLIGVAPTLNKEEKTS